MPAVVMVRNPNALPKGLRFLDDGEERVLVSGVNALGVLVGTPRANPTFLVGRSGGPRGAAGLSAYDLAVQEGFEGSLQDWFDQQRQILVLNPGDPTPDPSTLLNHTLLLERT